MNSQKVTEYIINWMLKYLKKSNMNGFVIGISGGIDSAIVSTLAAKTKKKVLVLNIPIHQNLDQIDRANQHISWLKKNFINVESCYIDLSSIFDSLNVKFKFSNIKNIKKKQIELSLANMRSRLRMVALYYYAGINKYLVTGTGNKIEDFGIGFFTKYGDGGVDILPIGNLMKSEVYKLGKYFNIINSIQKAKPVDGLWNDNRNDEEQIGASYDELEWVMNHNGNFNISNLTLRQKKIIKIYNKFHKKMKHKIDPIPICNIPKYLF